MNREPIPTWCFALAVVRLGRRFLLVHERKHGQRWYLPAGRVEPGETFAQAAIRETLEEAGVAIALDGIVRVEHTARSDGARMRVVFVAHPVDDRPPKAAPDDESLGAAWVALDELARYSLRCDEVRALFEHVARGGAVYPLSLLVDEGRRTQACHCSSPLGRRRATVGAHAPTPAVGSPDPGARGGRGSFE